MLVITDKGFAGREFERVLGQEHRITLLRPSRKDEAERLGEPMLKSVRQLIESVNDTLKGQLDLEQHGARSFEGIAIRVAQRILAMAAAIWHNFRTGQAVSRSMASRDSSPAPLQSAAPLAGSSCSTSLSGRPAQRGPGLDDIPSTFLRTVVYSSFSP